MQTINVILTGGVGSRLWPLSRKARPKQYIPLFDNKSLFELTIERNQAVSEKVIIVGNRDNYMLSRDALKTNGGSYAVEIIEATPRNTAAAIAFAAFSAAPEDVLIVTPSDHIIADAANYHACVTEAVALAKEGNLVTFGIRPTKPETGYGYIEHQGNQVASFREKPDKKTAEQFIIKGNFLWNSGIFCFKAGVYLKELERLSPEIFTASKQAWRKGENHFLPLEESLAIPSLSVDYAVMEKSDKIKVIPSNFIWSDLGSFEAIMELCEMNRQQYHFCGSNLVLGTNKRVETLGIEDCIVVDTADALLVVHKSNSQEVKKIYERLEKENPELT